MSDPYLRLVTLQNDGIRIKLLNYGAITADWQVNGVSVVRGFKDPTDYMTDSSFTGIIAGRVANRTKGGRFTLARQAYHLSKNDDEHHLHGGERGLGKRFWTLDTDGPTHARLTYHSPDGEEGYPGAVDFSVDVTLNGTTLTYDMRATPDRPTPINMAQHNYYNLAGSGTVWGHNLWVDAVHMLPVDYAGIPTGAIEPITGTNFDFNNPRMLTTADSSLDHNFIFSSPRDQSEPIAKLSANGLCLQMWSDQPGAQVYTGAKTGVCIEPQFPPNVLNQPDFGSIIATPDSPYRQILRVDIRKE